MTFLHLIILSLAAFRLTHLIVYDKIFEPIRNMFVKRDFSGMRIGNYPIYELQGGRIRRTIGTIMNCHWCAGLWVSAVMVYGFYSVTEFNDIPMFFYMILAVSAIVSLLETVWQKVVRFPEMMEGTIKNESEDVK